MIPCPNTNRTMWKLACAPIFLRRFLVLVVVWVSTWACHAQTAFAVFDTLNVRHDLSKPAIVRFQAARYHVTACMYAGRADDQRSTALLLLDLATELKQDTLLAVANTTVSYSCRENDPGTGIQYLYKALEHAERGGDPDQIGRASCRERV